MIYSSKDGAMASIAPDLRGAQRLDRPHALDTRVSDHDADSNNATGSVACYQTQKERQMIL